MDHIYPILTKYVKIWPILYLYVFFCLLPPKIRGTKIRLPVASSGKKMVHVEEYIPLMKTILKPTFMPKQLYTLKDIYNSRLHAYSYPPTPKIVTMRAIFFFSPFCEFHGRTSPNKSATFCVAGWTNSQWLECSPGWGGNDPCSATGLYSGFGH